MPATRNELRLILNNIRSVYNVGAIFRTADAVGVKKIYLTGYTPTPLDRFGRTRNDLAKSALGAEKNIPWESVKNISTLIKKLKKDKFQIVSLEQSPKSVDYKKFKPNRGIALILGNEVGGIPDKILNLSDKIIEIPMRGKLARNRQSGDIGKESLNVSVSAGIAIFRLLDC